LNSVFTIPALRKTGVSLTHFTYAPGKTATGTRHAVESITTGLRWRPVHEPLTLRSDFHEDFISQCKGLGAVMAAGIEAGVF